MTRIAVIGAGLVGRAWAIVFARAGHEVALYDANANTLAESLDEISSSLRDLKEFDLIGEEPDAIRARMSTAQELCEALDGADHAQESTFEKLEVKAAIFSEMDAIAAPNTTLASSSSTFTTSTFAARLKGRSRCLVAHPVNPPHLIPLVEICPAPFTAENVVQRTRKLMEAVGQKPVLVKKEIQGFVLNRLQWTLLSEAYRLVDDDYIGVEDLDKTIKEGLGLRWSFIGPFEVGDLNAPGGIADYSRRFGDMIYEMDASPQSTARRWSDDLITRIEKERRQRLPATDVAERSQWRDRRLMALVAHKRKEEEK